MVNHNSEIPVVILCGGMGTRLREETEYRPKPMVEIGGRPILWHIMKTYGHHGFKKFVLCLGYKGQMIKQYFLNYKALNSDFTLQLDGDRQPLLHQSEANEDWTITFVDTGESTLTGARVKRVEPFVQSDLFMLTYGDGVADVDLGGLLEFHRSHGKIGTVTGVRPYSRFGELVIQDGRVNRFSEKPQVDEGIVNGGYFIFNRKFFDYLSAEESCVLEHQPLENLSRDGELMVYFHKGFWQCMDTYRDFLALDEMWKKNPKWKVWSK
ncbi:MAG TPA: glucose-1-phosphate cytidylyltransferase [Terriglobia bacterium]|nr:glucose-1-phosphate cytidylyltransferase [Terriglobia bacterium]